ncbi:MAG: integration host factor subunit alpha [SAR324 cluster bacterium]|uniref:Integration host factor subunit alpha n=1 Tax=SAR324 cluster bacterium TaxID=2024889 RepID=A0A2A4TCF7_9DELT|nr:MAG: integration host factor subunit alpha [SAR324 cluster bacterium]
MTKAELVASVAEKSETSKATAEKVIKALLESIQGALVEKRSVTLVGFGTFYTNERAARKGRNPRTNEEIEIAAATVPKFKAGKGLKDAVNA